MINQTDLKYFVEAAKTQHISRAAERLGITQPALSHCIKRIEAEAKISLFTRSKKGVQLTSAGQKFLSGVNDLIAKWDEVLRGAQDEIQELKGVVRFGCHSAVAQYVLPALLPDF